MNLLKTFPEIDHFFKNDRFTQMELLDFVSKLDDIYLDKNLRKQAATLVRLKILQYNLYEEKVITSTAVKYKKEKAKKHNRCVLLADKNIIYIAGELQFSVARLLRLFKLRGVDKSPIDILSYEEFKTIEEIISARLFGLDRMKKAESKVKMPLNSSNKKTLNTDDSVYHKIKAIGLGKIIYIRKK